MEKPCHLAGLFSWACVKVSRFATVACECPKRVQLTFFCSCGISTQQSAFDSHRFMAGVLLLLLLLPFALAIVAYFAFRFLAFNYGLRTLVVSGTVWVGALFFWTFLQTMECELPPSAKGNNGCGFISFLGSFETASLGAATLLTLILLFFWVHQARKPLTNDGGR